MEKLFFKIHNDGWSYIVISIILAIVFIPFFPIIGVFFIILTVFIINFFRDPKRSVPIEDMIVSPADGVITYIGNSSGPKELSLGKKYTKISIFLNIFNVHVNRVPTYGRVKNIIYAPG